MKKNQFGEYEVFKCQCGEDSYISLTRFDKEEIEVNITSTKLIWSDRFKHTWRTLVHGETESWNVIANRTELIDTLERFARPDPRKTNS